MKKTLFFLLVLLLVSGTSLSAGNITRGSMPQAALPANPAPPASTPTPKMIKDQNEFNAYTAALNTQDPAARAAAMEAFAKQYPNSIVRMDALEQAMAAYQQARNPAKIETTARSILQTEPDNVHALAIVTALVRDKATQGDKQAAAELPQDAAAGLKALGTWQRPEGVSDADYSKSVKQMQGIFNGAVAFDYLQQSDFAKARDAYLQALQADPTSLQDTYQLGIADLSMTPADVLGFWYLAKAVHLAKAFDLANGNDNATRGINTYGKGKYYKYHGSDEGWIEIVTAAETQSVPPHGFTVKAAPTPADLACQAVEQNNPSDLSFSDWEYVLQYRDAAPCNKEAADKVWAAIQDKQKQGTVKLKLPQIKIISATKESIDAAIAEENQQANKADLRITMAKPMLHAPAPGATIDIVGVITDYTPKPFLFIMQQGEVPAAHAVRATPRASAR